jgi:hypothetical protein
MPYRAVAILITAFWLVMMIALVRLETHPEATDILDVPVSYVMRLIFRHQQISSLTMRDGAKEIGTIYMHPAVTGTDARTLSFSGSMSPMLPNGSMARMSFRGVVHLNAALNVHDFHADISMLPTVSHLTLDEDAEHNTISYAVKAGNAVVAAQTLPMTTQGLMSALAQYPELRPLAALAPSSFTPPTVTARESTIPINGEALSVYQVTISEAASPLFDIYVTQLGQIVSARTNSGFNLTAEGMP